MGITSTIYSWNLENKTVFLRADLNVPLKTGAITDDYRLKAILPTIKLIQEKGGIIIIATHIGRPKDSDPSLSTNVLVPWFEQQKLSVLFAPTIKDAHSLLQKIKHSKKMLEKESPLILLENLRFFAGEKTKSLTFAQELATLGDFYVNDAFGTLHRQDSSVAFTPTFFPSEKKTVGLLIEKELRALAPLQTAPERPFVALLGGGKVADKLPLLKKILLKTDTLLVCPAISFTFLKAEKKQTGKSLINSAAITECADILKETANKTAQKIILPLDYQVALDNIHGPLSYVDADAIPENSVGISIGPKTIAAYSKIIATAKTIFFNAAMGFTEREETLSGTNSLIEAIAKAPGYSVVGGGDSVAAAKKVIQKKKIEKKGINRLSTGGGATLAYISGENMPGLEALFDRTEV